MEARMRAFFFTDARLDHETLIIPVGEVGRRNSCSTASCCARGASHRVDVVVVDFGFGFVGAIRQ